MRAPEALSTGLQRAPDWGSVFKNFPPKQHLHERRSELTAVLWIRIRIRNNPNVLAGSESESEKKVRIRIRIWIQTLL
jgi:hypothetical protein